MIALLLMFAQATATSVAPPPATAAPLPPQDWSKLPPLRIRRAATETPDVSAFVQNEVAAGRCAAAQRSANGWTVTVDLALLVTADGRVRRVTPRAINCPTVEQYAAGLLLGKARDAADLRWATTESWYRTTAIFAWR